MRPDDLPPREKLQLVMEAAKFSDKELGAFLRGHGLHEAQLEEWRQAALGALQKPKKRRPGKSPETKRIQELEREVMRKDKALAEVTALLALKKKLDALLGDEDDDTTRRSAR
jgi:transposase-like protein